MHTEAVMLLYDDPQPRPVNARWPRCCTIDIDFACGNTEDGPQLMPGAILTSLKEESECRYTRKDGRKYMYDRDKRRVANTAERARRHGRGQASLVVSMITQESTIYNIYSFK